MIDEAAIRARYEPVAALLDERARRLLAGTEARAIGRGGVSAVARATGLARSTVQRGVADVGTGATLAKGRVRRAGAGRPRSADRDPTLRRDLEALIEVDIAYADQLCECVLPSVLTTGIGQPQDCRLSEQGRSSLHLACASKTDLLESCFSPSKLAI